MVKRFLVTTALEETWCDDEPLLFLGEWCRRFSRKTCWSQLDAEVMPYHWDDREKLFADYQYLQNFHERLLVNLTAQLNDIHGVDHSVRYWRILIGPWLGYFIQMLFDRWTSIQQAVSQYELSGTIVRSGYEDLLVPNDMTHFTQLFVGDAWNHHIYAAILQQFTTVPCIKKMQMSDDAPKSSSRIPIKKKILRQLATWCSQAASTLVRDRDAFFLGTYLTVRDEIRLHRRFGQIPQRWSSVSPIQIPIDDKKRQWIVSGETHSAYETCAHALIAQQIPAVYLEGYPQLMQQAAALPWPKRPQVIFTSSAENSDDVFKIWAAEKIEQGSPLVIGQHGGHYGVGRWSFAEEHEIAISDCYLSWGWTDAMQPKLKPIGQLKSKQPLGVRQSEQTGALLVTCALPQFSYWMYSVFVSRQWLDYFGDQCAFVEHLPAPVRNALTVRLFAHNYEWDQVPRWRERFPDLCLDEGTSNIDHLIRHSRLYIATYNATTFLESFTMNVPTVIFWNPQHWELRDSAIPYFDDLKRVGIFHETPASAARHVAQIWDDVDAWWNSAEVQGALGRFKARYCYLPNNMLDRVEQTLREIMTVSDTTALRMIG